MQPVAYLNLLSYPAHSAIKQYKEFCKSNKFRIMGEQINANVILTGDVSAHQLWWSKCNEFHKYCTSDILFDIATNPDTKSTYNLCYLSSTRVITRPDSRKNLRLAITGIVGSDPAEGMGDSLLWLLCFV